MTPPPRLERRHFMLGAGALVAAAACTGSDSTATSSTIVQSPTTTTLPPVPATSAVALAAEVPALTAADFERLGACRLTPMAPEGPFPNLDDLERRDIAEGEPGRPMRVGFRVLDASCAPLAGARVEIWHCDATGDYSSYEDGGSGKDQTEGTTFCRGTQTADAAGIVEFQSIYPGWYEGRAVHIHLTVQVDGATLTSQVYLDEAYTEDVYMAAPYVAFGAPDTSHDDDGLSGDPRDEGTLMATRDAETAAGFGTLALINLTL